MRKGVVLLGFLGLINAGLAAACDIDDKREIQVGTGTGVAGACSNNGSPVQCFGEGEEADSLTCNGPEGSYSGSNLQQLVSAACGCGAGQGNGAAEQISQELGGALQ